MRRRDERIERIRAVEREYQVAQAAVSLLRAQLDADPSALNTQGLRYRDFAQLNQNLDATYLLRLFAEFETGLRQAWQNGFGRTTHPRVVELVASLAAQCVVPADCQERVHEVRRYRNSLVHEEDSDVAVIPLAQARGHLCRFFSFLPSDW